MIMLLKASLTLSPTLFLPPSNVSKWQGLRGLGIPFALLKSNLNLLNVKLVIIVRKLANAPKIICPTRLYTVLCESIVRFKQSAMRALAALPRQSAQPADLVTKGVEMRAFRYLVKAPPARLGWTKVRHNAPEAVIVLSLRKKIELFVTPVQFQDAVEMNLVRCRIAILVLSMDRTLGFDRHAPRVELPTILHEVSKIFLQGCHRKIK